MNEQIPTVSIIICTSGRAAFLRETLQSLAGVRVPEGCACELIVVDNASTDDTPAVAQSAKMPSMPVRSIREERRGKGHAYNAGLAAARGDVLLLTDDDVRLPPDWISGMAAPILTGRADAVAGGVRVAASLERPWMTPGHPARLASTERLDPDNPDAMIGANMAFARAVLARVPAFDPELGPGALGFGDETLFTWQLREAGLRTATAFDVVVEHHFAPDRLLRVNLLKMAAALGHSGGYLSYHWKHDALPLPGVRLAKCRLWLWGWRLAHPRACSPQEGMSAAEIELVQKVAFLEQYRREQKRPPHYEKRGLVRLGNF